MVWATKAQRDKGILKSEAINEYRKFRAEAKKAGISKETDIKEAFLTKWNKEHPDFQCCLSTFYAWLSESKSGNPEKLIDKRGGWNRGKSTIPEYYANYFKDLYLQQTKPSINSCYEATITEASKNGDIIPGLKAFRNYVDHLDSALITRMREGEKAFTDKCLPYTERDYTLLQPNQYWVSDHHLWDVFVRIPDEKGGWKLARPWGSYWMDMRTRKFMSSIVRVEAPNADIVLCSFALGVEHFGIPYGVRLDNGKDYKARDMFYPEGHYIVSEEEKERIFDSLASNLDLAVTYAIPYNAKAKPIERAFRTHESKFGKLFPSYAGSDAKQRPEDLKNMDIMDVITLEDFIALHNQYIYEIYNESPHSGDGMFGKSPNQVYCETLSSIRTASKEALFFALMRVKGSRTVQRNGITFGKAHYYNDKCIKHLGKKVYARYNPGAPDILYIFDADKNYLFDAHKVQKKGWNLTESDYHEENHRKKIAKQMVLNSYTADNTIRSSKSISARLKDQAESIEKADIARPGTIELVRNPEFEEAAKQMNMSEIERNYNDILMKNKSEVIDISEKQKELADRFKKKMLDRAAVTSI